MTEEVLRPLHVSNSLDARLVTWEGSKGRATWSDSELARWWTAWRHFSMDDPPDTILLSSPVTGGYVWVTLDIPRSSSKRLYYVGPWSNDPGKQILLEVDP